jgi:hypothetical protein
MKVLFVLFLIGQALDGILTYMGIQRWGMAAEANPLLHWLEAVCGLVPSILFFKLGSMWIGTYLYKYEYFYSILFLTVLIYGVAVLPWTYALLFF